MSCIFDCFGLKHCQELPETDTPCENAQRLTSNPKVGKQTALQTLVEFRV